MKKTCNLCCIIADLQMVNISLRVLYRPDQKALPEIYRQLGLDYDDRVLPSICNEVGQISVNRLCMGKSFQFFFLAKVQTVLETCTNLISFLRIFYKEIKI